MSRDASVAVAAESTRESHDITSERLLVTRHFPRPALGRLYLIFYKSLLL